jgi:hypothetical protein
VATNSKADAVSAILEYYRVKYPTRAARIAALKTRYLELFESGALTGTTLSSSSVDGISSSFLVSLPKETLLAAYAEALKIAEGRRIYQTVGRVQ